MSFIADILAEGQVSDSEGVLYTVPSSTKAYIRFMTFFNTNATPQTLILYVRKGAGTSRKFFQCELSQNRTMECDSPIALGAGDTIRAETTTASVVNFVISGAEQV